MALGSVIGRVESHDPRQGSLKMKLAGAPWKPFCNGFCTGFYVDFEMDSAMASLMDSVMDSGGILQWIL